MKRDNRPPTTNPKLQKQRHNHGIPVLPALDICIAPHAFPYKPAFLIEMYCNPIMWVDFQLNSCNHARLFGPLYHALHHKGADTPSPVLPEQCYTKPGTMTVRPPLAAVTPYHAYYSSLCLGHKHYGIVGRADLLNQPRLVLDASIELPWFPHDIVIGFICDNLPERHQLCRISRHSLPYIHTKQFMTHD